VDRKLKKIAVDFDRMDKTGSIKCTLQKYYQLDNLND